jgi:ribosomal protein S18 acetylase RimI-like enzyme
MAEGPVWIVIEENAIVGTLGAIAKGDDLYLRSMAVSPRARGRKIGWHLLETASLFAGDRDLVLSTTPFLDRAIALYERWGFRHTDEPPHDLFGTPLFTMRKKCSVLSARCSVLGFTKH